ADARRARAPGSILLAAPVRIRALHLEERPVLRPAIQDVHVALDRRARGGRADDIGEDEHSLDVCRDRGLRAGVVDLLDPAGVGILGRYGVAAPLAVRRIAGSDVVELESYADVLASPADVRVADTDVRPKGARVRRSVLSVAYRRGERRMCGVE